MPWKITLWSSLKQSLAKVWIYSRDSHNTTLRNLKWATSHQAWQFKFTAPHSLRREQTPVNCFLTSTYIRTHAHAHALTHTHTTKIMNFQGIWSCILLAVFSLLEGKKIIACHSTTHMKCLWSRAKVTWTHAPGTQERAWWVKCPLHSMRLGGRSLGPVWKSRGAAHICSPVLGRRRLAGCWSSWARLLAQSVTLSQWEPVSKINY